MTAATAWAESTLSIPTREGDVTITGIVIPFADPGFYPVKIVVGTGGSAETAIVQLEILTEGTGSQRSLPAALPGARDPIWATAWYGSSTSTTQHQGLDVLRPAP